jgi:hypothetical protein
MNPGLRIITAVPLVVLVSTAACNRERPPESVPTQAQAPVAPAVAEAAPPKVEAAPAPSSRYDVRCERILPEELRKKHMYGWPVTESAGPDRATCTFDEAPFKRIIVVVDCRERAGSAEREAEVKRGMDALGLKELSGPGRRAIGTRGGVPTLFWDDDTHCEVSLDRVGWGESDAAGISRAQAVAEALSFASISR